MVRRPNSLSWYDPKFTVKTMITPWQCNDVGAFSGNLCRAGSYFLPKDVIMKESIYINILKEHLFTFWRIHQCDPFMHDGAPALK